MQLFSNLEVFVDNRGVDCNPKFSALGMLLVARVVTWFVSSLVSCSSRKQFLCWCELERLVSVFYDTALNNNSMNRVTKIVTRFFPKIIFSRYLKRSSRNWKKRYDFGSQGVSFWIVLYYTILLQKKYLNYMQVLKLSLLCLSLFQLAYW